MHDPNDPTTIRPWIRVVVARKTSARGWPLTPLRDTNPVLEARTKAPAPDLSSLLPCARAGNVG